MPERELTKNLFKFNKGLDTESNELNFSDGYSTDEQNYELLVDGSRRRRRGLQEESGGSAHDPGPNISASAIFQAYKWRSISGDPNENQIVYQMGSRLYFSDDAETISTTFNSSYLDLELRAAPNASQSDIAGEPVQFSQGRGYLFVTSRYLEPFYVEYDISADRYTSKQINILIRDFDGIEDGVGIDVQPTTLTEDHEYNLRNRGWKEDDITQYETDKSAYPSKVMVWYKGYRRLINASYLDEDGIQEWSSDKIEDEIVGNSDSQQGSLFLNPFDTTTAVSVSGGALAVSISTWSVVDNGSTWTITVTANAHGRSNGESVTISGQEAIYRSTSAYESFNFNGEHTIAGVTTNTFEITVNDPGGFLSWEDQYLQSGQVDGGSVLERSNGAVYDERPVACAWHAGRIFYSGIPNSEYADRLFFSPVVRKPQDFGKCHQKADPTAPEINALLADDGGEFTIPNLGNVKRMISVRDVLLVFTDQGVWEVGGGSRGFFTADAYSVRKITGDEASSALSPIVIGSSIFFTGPKGIFQIAPNQYTGALEAANISESRIQTLWNSIDTTNQETVQTAYDDALKRLYFLHGDSDGNANQYTTAIILDLRLGAWYKYVFDVSATSGLLGIFSITDSDSTADNKKIKWITQATNNVEICDLAQSDYVDFGGSESPLPYVVTGWDNLGDFQLRRQAPIITVYAKRTETGYTDVGGGTWTPNNFSSNKLTPYWDWTDSSVSGKVGTQIETYRKVRDFTPANANDTDDGYPVVVTRNKVRGRGRVLQLRFDGAATKDSYILGFTTNYKVVGRV